MQIRLLFALVGFLIVAMPIKAQLSINISDDLGGYCRPGDWFPIVVSISNQTNVADDAVFDGRIIVESQSLTSEAGDYQFVRDVTVPASSNKRYVLYAKLPENTTAQFNVTIRRSNGQLVQTLPLNATLLEQSDLLALNVTADASRLNLPFLRPNNVSSLRQAIRAPQFLPDNWAGYDAADIVIFSEWPTNTMTSTKIKALKDWIGMGGTLILLGGSVTNTYQDEAALEFLPLDLTGTTTYAYNTSLERFAPVGDSLENDEAFIFSNGNTHQDANLLLEASGGVGDPIPLVVQKDLGKGQIVFLGTDFREPNRNLRDFISPYYFALLPETNRVHWRHQIVDYLNDKLVLITGAAAKPPSTVIIIMICILYTLIVGPVNFFVLAKMDKIQLAWVTVPAIVFIFSGLIYGLGSLTKGSQTIARETSLFIGKQDESNYEMKSDIGFLSASAASLTLTPNDDSWSVADHDRWYGRDTVLGFFTDQFGASAGGGLDFGGTKPIIKSTDEGIAVEDWRLRTFGYKHFEVRGCATEMGTIESTLAYGNNNASFWFEGEIQNLSEWDFYDSALLFGRRGFPLGPMAQGDSISLNPNETRWTISSGGGVRPNWDSAIDTFLPETLTGTEETDEAINRENAGVLLRGILDPEKVGRLLPSIQGKLYFVGLAESPELSCEMNINPDRGQRSIVVMVELNPVPKTGQFTVFPDFVNVRLLADDSNTPNHSSDFVIVDETPRYIEMRNRSAVFAVDLPFRSNRLLINGVQSQVNNLTKAETQEFNEFVVAYNSPASPMLFNQGILPNFANSSYLFAPYNGRFFTVIESKAPRDEDGKVIDTGFLPGQTHTRLLDVGYRVEGKIE